MVASGLPFYKALSNIDTRYDLYDRIVTQRKRYCKTSYKGDCGEQTTPTHCSLRVATITVSIEFSHQMQGVPSFQVNLDQKVCLLSESMRKNFGWEQSRINKCGDPGHRFVEALFV